jgi:hypothetical protein
MRTFSRYSRCSASRSFSWPSAAGVSRGLATPPRTPAPLFCITVLIDLSIAGPPFPATVAGFSILRLLFGTLLATLVPFVIPKPKDPPFVVSTALRTFVAPGGLFVVTGCNCRPSSKSKSRWRLRCFQANIPPFCSHSSRPLHHSCTAAAAAKDYSLLNVTPWTLPAVVPFALPTVLSVRPMCETAISSFFRSRLQCGKELSTRASCLWRASVAVDRTWFFSSRVISISDTTTRRL